MNLKQNIITLTIIGALKHTEHKMKLNIYIYT